MEKHREGYYCQPFNKAFLVKGKAKNPKVLIESEGVWSVKQIKIIADSTAKVGISSYMNTSLGKISPNT